MRAQRSWPIAVLGALFAAASAAGTAQAGSLQSEDIARAIERHHPLIAAAVEDRVAAEAELMAARGAFDLNVRGRADATPLGYYKNGRFELSLEQPTPLWGMSVFGGWRLGAGSFADYDGKLETNDYGELRAGLALPLWRNGQIDRRRAGLERAKLGPALGQAGLRQQRLEVMRLGLGRYWEWVAAGQRLAIAKSFLRLAETRDQALAERVRRGDLPDIERVENQRALLGRRGFVLSAERSLVQAQLELSLYLRDEQGAPLVPEPSQLPARLPAPGPLPGGEEEATIAAALRLRPDVERLHVTRQQLEIDRRLLRNQLAPAMDLSFAISQDLGPGSYTRSATQLDLGLLIEMPVPNRTARGRLRVAEAALRRLEAGIRLLRDRVRTEVRDALSALTFAAKRVEVAAAERAVAEQVESAERARFELGDGTLLIVNLREQATAEAALRELDALLDYHRAMATYQAVTARLDMETDRSGGPLR